MMVALVAVMVLLDVVAPVEKLWQATGRARTHRSLHVLHSIVQCLRKAFKSSRCLCSQTPASGLESRMTGARA